MRLAMLLVLALAAPAAGQPILRVRARTRVELESLRRASLDAGRMELLIRGRLVDADLGTGIDQGTVVLDLDGKNGFFKIALVTLASGAFEARPQLQAGEYWLRILGGKEDPEHLYDRAPPLERTLDLARTTPLIALHAADQASAAQPSMLIEIDTAEDALGDDASSAAQPPLQPIELALVVLVNETWVAGVTTHAGRAAVEIPLGSLGRPGATAELVVRFAGDLLRNPAEARHRVRVTTPTQLTLSASSTQLEWRGSIELSGRLDDASGPVAGARVEIVASSDDRLLVTAQTDARGRFSAKLEGGKQPPGTAFVEARFGAGGFREPSRSPALALTLLSSAPHPLGFWLSPLFTALAIGVALLARKQPWRRVSERRASARARRAANPTVGLTENRPRLFSTLRPAHDHGLSGVVVELPSLRGLPSAQVTLAAGSQVHTLAVDAQGRFAVEALPAGPVIVEVSAPGYLPERFFRTLPHRGELRSARVTLVPIRERIFATYRAAVVLLLPEPRLAETWTPRELQRHVARRRLLSSDLDALTQLVELACFGAHLPDAALLAETERLAAAVREGHASASRALHPSMPAL